MQTFLPYPDYTQSAICLDNKRLGKQRVECLQILNALAIGPYQQWDHVYKKWIPAIEKEYHARKFTHTRKTPWYNHPAVRMWRGFEAHLLLYSAAVCVVWQQRGFRDTCLEKLCDIQRVYKWFHYTQQPPWLGREDFHASHRSNLLRKDPAHYSQFKWTTPNNLPYVWPI